MELINNVDKLHTTKLGIDRISKNLNIDGDVVLYCKNLQLNEAIILLSGDNKKLILKWSQLFGFIEDTPVNSIKKLFPLLHSEHIY